MKAIIQIISAIRTTYPMQFTPSASHASSSLWKPCLINALGSYINGAVLHVEIAYFRNIVVITNYNIITSIYLVPWAASVYGKLLIHFNSQLS